ncbi:for, partial [Symbiodinium necroappetens]
MAPTAQPTVPKQVAIAGDTSADMEVKAHTATPRSAQLRDIGDKIDDLAKTLKKDRPERQAVKESSAEAIGHLNARVDGLADRIQEVESANTRTRSFEIEALPPVGQVQLVNAKADMQQAILTAALGARAQIQGKVDASDHMRAELLHGLNVSLESAMAQEQSTLQRSEANVAETARKAVDGTLTSVLKASMDKVLGVGLAAASLTSEAETLQGNATALLDQVEAEASSGEDAVQRLPSSALVEQRIRQVEGEVQEMRQEAAAAEGGAGAALEEMEKALEVVHRSATKAEKAKALRGRAAEQAAKNAAEIRRIRLQLTGGVRTKGLYRWATDQRCVRAAALDKAPAAMSARPRRTAVKSAAAPRPGPEISEPKPSADEPQPRRSSASAREAREDVPDLEKLLEELDQSSGPESVHVQSVQSKESKDMELPSEPASKDSSRRGTDSKPYRPLDFQSLAEGCPDLRQRCKEAFESVVKESLHEDAPKPCREKPKPRKLPSRTPKSEHWNFSFNVNREVVGAELLELDEEGLPQPPTQDLRQLPRSKSRKAEALPGLPGLRPPNFRPEPGLARFRAIPCQENEWIEGLKKMAEAQRSHVGRAPSAMGCGSSREVTDEERLAFLGKVELFKRLPRDELPALARSAEEVLFAKDDVIIKQGAEGDEFFILKRGTAGVEVNGHRIATLKAGDYFGENALLRDTPSISALLEAASEIKALRITREAFVKLELHTKLEFGKRGAVGGGKMANAENKAADHKTDGEKQLIAQALKNNANLNMIASLDDEKIRAMVKVMWKEEVPKGTALIQQGDLQADYFYVVQSGSFQVSKTDSAASAEKVVSSALGTIEAGGSFGELALLYFAPRAATLTATANAVVWVTARQQFKELLMKANETEIQENLKHVSRCDCFSPLKDTEKKELAAAMNEMTFSKEELVFEQGERGTQFFLLVEGEVSVVKDGKEVTKIKATPEKAPYFGEKALLEDEPRAATIKVLSNVAKGEAPAAPGMPSRRPTSPSLTLRSVSLLTGALRTPAVASPRAVRFSAAQESENVPSFLACRSELGQELEALLRREVLEAEHFPVGDYVVISLAKVMVGPSKELSPPPFLKELAKGETVEVLEVQALPQDGRIRGRTRDGWISLQNLDSGFRWAWPRSFQEDVFERLRELRKRSFEDPELEADLLYLKALLGRLSVGLPALKSFQSNKASKTWALFGRGLEQWDSVAGDHSYEVPLTKVSEPLRRELFRALGSKAYMRDLVQSYMETQELGSHGTYGDFLERFRKVKDALLTDIGGASGLSGLSGLSGGGKKAEASESPKQGSWTQEDIAQWLQVFTAITSSTRVYQADVYFGHATFGLCLRRLIRRFELALSLQKDATQEAEAAEAVAMAAAPSELVLENFRNFVEMVSRPSSEDATMDEVLKLSSAVLLAIRRQTESLFGKGLREELQVPLDRASSLINDDDDPAPTTPPIGKMASLLLEAAEAGELRMLSVSKMGAKERTMWDALSFGYFLQTLVVDKESFEILLGSLQELTRRGKDGTGSVKKPVTVAPSAAASFGKIKFKDLKKLGLLGCGGFGAVEMVEHLNTGETYALKALSKGYVVKSGMQSSVISEKNVQLLCDSPFIVKLYETFNYDQSLYFLLELALGGELYATYNKKNFWGNEKCGKFYVAGTVFAFEHLHSKKIIFRDLKPENLLLNDKGHVKLTDMGLAKVVPGKTFTTCGTPDYFAPELIASKGHTLAVDWWTLGILTFELCSGHPPFESATPMQIYAKAAPVRALESLNGGMSGRDPLHMVAASV